MHDDHSKTGDPAVGSTRLVGVWVKWLTKGLDQTRCGIALHVQVRGWPLLACGLAAKLRPIWFVNRWRDNSRQLRIGPFICGYHRQTPTRN
jgi:hypothetical protein